MNIKIDPSWKKLLTSEFKKTYFKTLTEFVKKEYTTKKIYPPSKYIFNAFDQTPVNNVKVVIIGQDPYHGDNQANGLSFAVNQGIKIPPSLRNIYKELTSDIGLTPAKHGDLTSWAKQGVLLLNATLTVQAKAPGSHQKKGWEDFTNAVIKTLSEKKEGLVFILWGSYAQKKGQIINQENNHLILKSPHPSPFSAHSGFFGSAPFSKTNTFLMLNNSNPINWKVY